MSHEPAWLGAIGAILPPALGHLYHFILAVNVSSGLGLREKTLGRVRLVLLAMLLGSAGLLLWKHTIGPWWTWPLPWRAYALCCVVSGGIVWPLCSLSLETRRRPEGVSRRSERLDLARECGSNALIGKARGSWQLRLPGNESLSIYRREYVASLDTVARIPGHWIRPPSLCEGSCSSRPACGLAAP